MNYELRGKCKEYSEQLVAERHDLRLVRGHYWCPIWNSNEQHWWCEDQAGNVVDPTKDQFPSAGMGDYVEFDGMCSCEQCGKQVPEAEAEQCGRFVVCSYTCACRLVGL